MKVRQEPDALSARALRWAVIGFVVMIVVGWAATWWLAHPYASGGSEAGAVRSPRYRRMEQVNHMETSLFRAEPEPRPVRRAAEERLTSYGWVDRRGGIAHIPIERAIDLYLSRAGDAGGPPEGGAP